MKTINDYVLQAMEEITNASSDDLDSKIKKGETISKLAEVSIKEKEADAKTMEIENKKSEMLIKVHMMKAQLTGEVPSFDQLAEPLKITVKD